MPAHFPKINGGEGEKMDRIKYKVEYKIVLLIMGNK